MMYVITPGFPSIATVLGFFLLAWIGTMSHDGGLRYRVGWMVVALGGVALMGRALGVPALFYYVPGISKGMAVITSALFVLSGGCLMAMTKHWTAHRFT